jgi:magnesium chelatase family protein
VLRLARTIADLAGAETIAAAHVAEAVQYRRVDRGR